MSGCFIERDGDEAHIGGAPCRPIHGDAARSANVQKSDAQMRERARGGKRLESRGMLEPFFIDLHHGLYSVRERKTDRRGFHPVARS